MLSVQPCSALTAGFSRSDTVYDEGRARLSREYQPSGYVQNAGITATSRLPKVVFMYVMYRIAVV